MAVAPVGDAAAPSLYPRIDPAVIMAVVHGDWLLLGRQARWATDRYSLLAGARPSRRAQRAQRGHPGIRPPAGTGWSC